MLPELNAQMQSRESQVSAFLGIHYGEGPSMGQAAASQALEGLSGVGGFLGETALSIADNASLLPLAAINPALPLVIKSIKAAGSREKELTDQGTAAGEALSRGVVSGIIEGLSENVSLGSFLEMVNTGGRGWLLNLLKQAGVEGAEVTGELLRYSIIDVGSEYQLAIPYSTQDSFMVDGLCSVSGNTIIDGNTRVRTYIAIPGDATPDSVLEGATFSSSEGIEVTGTMPDNGDADIQLSDLTAKPVTAGYYSGGTAKVADAEAAKIIPENIKKGVTILGVAGTMEASAGYKVTFPATATNWNGIYGDYSGLLMTDGTIKPITDYSTLAGKTFENVVGIRCYGSPGSYVLKMTLSSGTIAQTNVAVQTTVRASFTITTSPNTTPTYLGSGRYTFWWPLTDVVISAIEMYNTD